jgi:mycothiol system anti-sigma-R factor
VLQQIELYLDGELRGELRIEVERHLGFCGPCLDHSAFQRRLKEVLRSKCGCGEVPPAVMQRVVALLAQDPVPPPAE